MPCVLQMPRRATSGGNTWPNGRVPYQFDGNVSAGQQAVALNVMSQIEGFSAVDFVARNGEQGYIHFLDGNQNSSPVGYRGGRNTITMFNWNFPMIVAHEIFHSIGFWHEQQRPDRDTYVRIEVQNLQPNTGVNFNIPSGAAAIGPYDFNSIMHYGQFAFSANGQRTITVLPPNQAQQGQLGNRQNFSVGDRMGVVARYGNGLPAQLAVATPSSASTWEPAMVTLTGSNLAMVSQLTVGGQSTSFTVVSDTEIGFTPPAGLVIGPVLIVATNPAGAGNALQFSITGNNPPILTGPPIFLRNVPLDLVVHSDTGWPALVLLSTELQPSSIPGIVSLGIGNQFAVLFSVGISTGDATGTSRISVTLPVGAPSGLNIFFQALSAAPGPNPMVPVPASNVHTSRIF